MKRRFAAGRPVDVAIVGGGPAGSSAAIACAEAGLSVVLISPPCGMSAPRPSETLHGSALPLLRMLGAGAAADEAALGHVGTLAVNGIEQQFGDDEPAVHIDRSRFDDALAALARKRVDRDLQSRVTAARLLPEGGVEISTADGRLIGAQWMVDASGRGGFPSRRFGMRRRTLSAPLVVRSGIMARGLNAEDVRFDARPWGWRWLTGVGTWTALQLARSPVPSEVQGLIDRSRADSVIVTLATWNCVDGLFDPGPVLPVGDAAGFVDPAAGMGMTNAIASGLAAAATISRCVKGATAAEAHRARYGEWARDRILDQARILADLYATAGIPIGMLNTSA